NCAAVPADLLESELFGHVRGAFSGAQADRAGKFQVADGGTLFLDEIGEMDYRLQAKLLRVIEEGIIEPLGSDRRIAVDVRIISSTNRKLEDEIAKGRFREDLFFRLNVLHIHVPPLRHRTEDVPDLARMFLAQFASELGKRSLSLDDAALPLLRSYRWRGNVRELRNVMERAVVLAETERVDASLIATLLSGDTQQQSADLNLARRLDEAEREVIEQALVAAQGNKAAAATLLGIGERTLWTKLRKHRR
ncbi:MAG: sigma-54-dependent Fis family transcriptional regulator, partial [Candidatus Dadabacteria bacterium]